MPTSAAAPREHRFLWEGRDRHGQPRRGELMAADAGAVQTHLSRQGVFLTRVRQARWGMQKALSRPDRAMFTRQLATMTKASLPLLQSLDLIARGPGQPGLQHIVQQLRHDVANGHPLSSAMARHTSSFPALYRQLVAVGESAGVMDHTLDRLALHEEKAWALRRQLRAALVYPLVVVLVALAVVVPTFDSVFASFGAELPLPTRVVLAASEWLVLAWWPALIALMGAWWLGRRLVRQSPALQRLCDAAPLRLPVVGPLLERALVARWARTLSTLLAAGIPLVDALGSVAQAAGNQVFEQATRQVQRSVAMGQRLSQALQGAAVFPPLVVHMTGVGEESGALDTLIGKTAELFEAQVDEGVKGLSSLLEPLIIVILGSVIGGIVVALYWPMFQLGAIV